VHLDLAITGLAGLAICHLADAATRPIPGSFASSPGRLIVEYDFILTLTDGRTRPICYDKIVQFLLWLRDNCGFRFGLVTADSFQSEHLLQTLYAEGIPTNRQSVDRDKKAYLVWRVGFQENNIRLYHQPQLLKEITGLVELDTKIDHQPNGNKDTTDAAAGAYLNAISSDEILILNIPQEPPAVVGILGHSNRLPEDPFGFTNRLPSRPPASFQRVILSSVHAESGPGESHEKHSLFINISHKTNPFQPIY
jgi:hypothetical protein